MLGNPARSIIQCNVEAGVVPPQKIQSLPRMTLERTALKSSKTTKEVGLLDGLPSGVSCTLGDLRSLLVATSGIGHSVSGGFVAVVRCGGDIVRMRVGRDLSSRWARAGGKLLFIFLPFLLV